MASSMIGSSRAGLFAGYLFRDRREVRRNCSAAGLAIVEYLARPGEAALLRAKSLLAGFPFAVVV
jgi:hypothetical protein